MTDEERLRQVATDLANQLHQYGLRPITFKQHDASSDGWWTPVASWHKDRPKIGVFFDRALRDSDRYFWFGFYSPDQSKMADLATEIRPKFPETVIVTQRDRESDSFIEKKIREVKQNGGLAYERYEKDNDNSDYFGKFEVGFTASSDEELVSQAAAFILEVIRFIEPEFDEQIDIDEIRKRLDLTPTARKQLILARKGQGKFRRDLFAVWGGGCAVTGCTVGEVLRASHIKPWKKSNNNERLDKNNGLLLTATLDALFDRGLISFNDDGVMIISPRIKEDQIPHVLSPQRKLHKELSSQQKKYLDVHRKELFLSS